jgi:hypothetical protein
LRLNEFKLGKFGLDLSKYQNKETSDDPANDAETGTDVEPVGNNDTEADQTVEPKTVEKPRKVFTNIRKIVDDVIKSYPNQDFKDVIDEISNKYSIPPLRLVRLFMHRTGTLATELPDGYSFRDFVSPQKEEGSGGTENY